jgi:hypothetical protein
VIARKAGIIAVYDMLPAKKVFHHGLGVHHPQWESNYYFK